MPTERNVICLKILRKMIIKMQERDFFLFGPFGLIILKYFEIMSILKTLNFQGDCKVIVNFFKIFELIFQGYAFFI